ncbi:hypothetical protein ABIC83_003022 [Roseateles asaccharophilus]|uniref:hypothetical protein n=1 Tax=Roseateles asaccharophilus TaxID=582607 RepID=UPI003832B763
MQTDIQAIYAKLANKEIVTEAEIVAMLKDLAHYHQATAYLASCQAATLESLPKATSKSSRRRHQSLCEIAAQLIEGNAQGIRHRTDPEAAKDRCVRAVKASQAE